MTMLQAIDYGARKIIQVWTLCPTTACPDNVWCFQSLLAPTSQHPPSDCSWCNVLQMTSRACSVCNRVVYGKTPWRQLQSSSHVTFFVREKCGMRVQFQLLACSVIKKYICIYKEHASASWHAIPSGFHAPAPLRFCATILQPAHVLKPNIIWMQSLLRPAEVSRPNIFFILRARTM